MTGKFALLAILLASQAWAERPDQVRFRSRTKASECTPLDARKAKPQLKKFYAARKTQDHVGWCYASAASDLLSHRLGRPVSSVDLAASYNRGLRSNPFFRALRNAGNSLKVTKTEQGAYEGGSIRGAIKEAKKYGACPADRIPSHINLEAERTGMELIGLLSTLQKTGKVIRETGASYEAFRTGLNLEMKYVKDGVECSTNIDGQNLFSEFFPGIDTRRLYRLLVEKADSDVNDILFEVTQQHCRNQRLDLKGIQVANLKSSDWPRWPEILDKRLKMGDIVGLEHRAGMLFPDQGLIDFHAVSVVARKFENGQCKYLLRDSLTAKCKELHKKLRKGCNPKNMNIWVPEKDINRHMLGMTYLK